MNDMITYQSQFDLSNPETIAMFQEALKTIANGVVSASDVASTVVELKQAVEELRAAVSLANSQREQAEAAYRQVNSQRIDAENALVSVRAERNDLEKELAQRTRDYDAIASDLTAANDLINEANADVAKWKEECEKLVKTSDETIASANAKARDANARAYEAEVKLAATSIKLEDALSQLAIAVTENETLKVQWNLADRRATEAIQTNDLLRSMIGDAVLVLTGEAAAE